MELLTMSLKRVSVVMAAAALLSSTSVASPVSAQ